MQPLLITTSTGSQCYNWMGNTNGTVLLWQHSLEVDFGVTCPGQLILCECVFVCVLAVGVSLKCLFLITVVCMNSVKH